ncbi:MAG: methionine--tRNA ligase [Nanoarchaeota archaeon]|nr:methionine--tRNA ligase [Nanoarchaeota archaeon]
MKSFFVTTPIYYVNGEPHLGTIYTTIAADIIARYKRFNNKKVFFLTGTDEHGEKVEQSAQKKGVSVKKYVDEMSSAFKEAFKKMNISYDRFIRTTDEDHIKTATAFYKQVFKKGDIYKGEYEGWYCVSCETFWTEKELLNNTCPDCGKKVKILKEETLFFKQSKYQKKLIEYINKHPDFIQPKIRRNEIISFLKKPLKDLSISRTSFTWGIPVPGEKKHVIYVWFDALINYLTASGYPKKGYTNIWPPDIQFMGKEITRFHCITWPIMLMSAGLELPRKVFGHGWWTLNAKKMSKSIGNVICPDKLCDKYNVPVDCVRYVLFKQMPFGSDGDFNESIFVEKVNNELGSELGNLVSRSLALFQRYNNSVVPKGEVDKKLQESYKKVLESYHKFMEDLDYYNALNSAFDFVRAANKYIADEEPWKLTRKEDNDKLMSVLFNLAQSLNIISALIYPFMPETSGKIDEQLSVKKDYNKGFKNVKPGAKTVKRDILFPKIEKIVEEKPAQELEHASFEDFKKLDIRTGTIIEVSELTDKLYRIKVKADKERTVVSGIRKYYSKKELLNKKVVILINLEPKKIMGVLSEGMILAAEKNNRVVLLSPDKDIYDDARVL